METAIQKKEDILGYESDEGIYCKECLPKDAKIQVVLTGETKADDVIYFCDKCHEEI